MAEFILPRMLKKGVKIAERTHALLELSVFLNKLDPERPWSVKVEHWKKARTDEQNKALFGLAYKIISEETGNDKDDIHDAMCRGKFGTIEFELAGQILTRPLRTTTRDMNGKRDVLDWSQFSDFYTYVESEAAKMGIRIPAPDPMWKTKGARDNED